MRTFKTRYGPGEFRRNSPAAVRQTFSLTFQRLRINNAMYISPFLIFVPKIDPALDDHHLLTAYRSVQRLRAISPRGRYYARKVQLGAKTAVSCLWQPRFRLK